MPDRLTDAELRQLAADHTPQPVPPCPECGAVRKRAPDGAWRCGKLLDNAMKIDNDEWDARHWVLGRWRPPHIDPRVLEAATELLERRAAEEP